MNQNKYEKYRIKNLIFGGVREDSLGSRIIKLLNEKYPVDKMKINSEENKNGGVLFIGNSYNEPGKIRMLIGVNSNDEIDIFGGKPDPNEKVIYTAIREAIEEIFNIKPDTNKLNNIIDYIISHPKIYYVYESFTSSYTYIFDVSFLGNIIWYLTNEEREIVPIQISKDKNIILNNYLQYKSSDCKDISFCDDTIRDSEKKVMNPKIELLR
jgi:hypothetical protein